MDPLPADPADGLLETALALGVARLGSPEAVARAWGLAVTVHRPSDLPGLLGVLAGGLGLSCAALRSHLDLARPHVRSALARAVGHGLTPLVLADDRYPSAFARLPDPPLVVWVRGLIGALDAPAIAVVGARTASDRGLATAFRLAGALAERGWAIVSGLARGVDGAAHRGALAAGGATVAILGSGADRIYPPEHADLAARLAVDGALLSEWLPGTPPRPAQFPKRNRLVSALARALLVVEGGPHSGSRQAAGLALRQGRPVLILRGAGARAWEALIKDGARWVETEGDLLEAVGPPAQQGAAETPALVGASDGSKPFSGAAGTVAGDSARRLRAGHRLIGLPRSLNGRGRSSALGPPAVDPADLTAVLVIERPMAKALVVVESPSKAKTIGKYLGRDFKVVASVGHVRDLPKSKLGVDVDAGFEPEYVVLPDRVKVIKELKDAAKSVDEIFVATDPDREGEAIGWHLSEELGAKRKIKRLMFNEITKKAILEAIKHPGVIDKRMVDAQQARRVLDRLVGYKISPILWDKVRRGLSAGRVQSVALKIICDREREIEAFVPVEYWHITARLAASDPPEFDARLARIGDAAATVANEAQAKKILADLEHATFAVASVATKERRKHAVPPFITSKLQQASRFPVKKTMMVAQQLYEGIELPGEDAPVGLITYMRTDSVRVAEQALTEVRERIGTVYGEAYVPEQANRYRLKANAQDAHEAIRPTSMKYAPDEIRAYLTPDQYYLYRLIWNRFIASQMTPAVFDDTTADITAGEYTFRAKGSVPKFAGWLAVYGQATGEAEESERTEMPSPQAGAAAGDADDATSGLLPPLAEGQSLEKRGITPEQKFTQPPARYSEATLVKALEEDGIGRPSTYASIITVLQAREYVNKIEGRFRPTILGRRLVDKLLHPVFDDILDVEYTARMEEQLDDIEKGKAGYAETLKDFYAKFKKDLKRAAKEMPNFKEGQPTGVTCDKCGQGEMVEKSGKFGIFLACSRYPDCDNTKELEPADAAGAEELEETCENCGKPMVLKRGRFGMFLACTGYPECKTTRKVLATKQGVTAAKPDQILDEKCPNCGKNLVIKQGRYGEFTACTGYPECKYVKQKLTGAKCPKDGGDIAERKSRRGKVFYGCVNYPKCDFSVWNKPVLEPCPKCGWTFLTEKITKRRGRQLVCANEECDYVRDAPEPAVEAVAGA